jgi:hypothetical protein
MPRERRVTVRLSDNEFSALSDYADSRHLLQSVGLRILLSAGLREEERGEPKAAEPTKDARA